VYHTPGNQATRYQGDYDTQYLVVGIVRPLRTISTMNQSQDHSDRYFPIAVVLSADDMTTETITMTMMTALKIMSAQPNLNGVYINIMIWKS